jgi:iron(III) transport system permease protein
VAKEKPARFWTVKWLCFKRGQMVATLENKSGRARFGRLSVLSGFAFIIAAVILIPILAVIYLAFYPSENIWPHLIGTTLPRYLLNSLVLMIATGGLAGVMGVAAAWLVVMKDFPARRLLEWALLLPLSIPTYIGAYALVDFWEYAGPFQTALREVFNFTSAADYWFPETRSRGAAIIVFSFSLYPYVYLLARSAFQEQSNSALETSRALGCGPWASFWKVGLPLARPAIVVGVAIVMMETLNDFGAVDFFAVQTLTTGIFTVWLEASNSGGAAQIATVLLAIILMLLMLERAGRKQSKFHQLSKYSRPPVKEVLSRKAATGAVVLCGTMIGIGFLMPFSIMLSHALGNPYLWLQADLWGATFTTIWVGAVAAALTVLGGVILIYAVRLSSIKWLHFLLPVTAIGYAAPGAVIGLGILIPMAAFDNILANWIEAATGVDIGLLITGTATAVIFAYCVRFFAIAFGAIDGALGRITPSMNMASRSLGQGEAGTLKRVHYPLIRGSLLTAGLLIFVDSSKELPATLLLRPFGFDTLATHIYGYASLEDINGAAPASIVIILVSLLAVLIVSKTSQRATDKK